MYFPITECLHLVSLPINRTLLHITKLCKVQVIEIREKS